MTGDISLPMEEENRRKLKSDFQKHFNLAKSAFRIANQIIKPDENIGIGRGERLTICLICVYVKQIRLFYSVYRLCERGLTDEASALARSMFELYVRLRYLDRLKRGKEEFALDWYIWYWGKHLPHLPTESKSNAARNELIFLHNTKELIESRKTALGAAKWKNFLIFGPWGKNMHDICENVDLPRHYETYKLFSGTLHGYDLFRYGIPDGRGGIEMNLPPVSRWIKPHLTFATGLLYDTMKIIDGNLGLGKTELIKDMEKCATALQH